MRAFIAIELNDAMRSTLCGIQDKFREWGIRGNYSFAENLHLTVKFLGEINDIQYHQICGVLEKIAPRHKSFVLTLDGIGNFKKGNKSILWAGLKKSRNLFEVYDEVEDEISKLFPDKRDKNYSPHITLVREAVSSVGNFDGLDLTECHGQSFTASGLSLMESTRVNGRLTYIRRAFEPFNNGTANS